MTENSNLPDNTMILDDIPVNLDTAMVINNLRLRNANDRINVIIQELVNFVTPVIRPKVLFKVSCLSGIDEKKLTIDGIEFSHNLKNSVLKKEDRIFPYIVTCGTEVETITIPSGDSMKTMREYCLNVIKTVVVRNANNYFREYLKEVYEIEEISHIGPGEIMGDISQQKKLFSLLGDVENTIGVRLSPHYLMVPEKSNSGIYFESKQNC